MFAPMPPQTNQSRVRRGRDQGPITPEIAKAYENDTRSKIAQAAIAAGISTAPTAEGQYAVPDAIARALSGALGGWQDKRMRREYGAQDDIMVAERAANAQRALDAQNNNSPAQASAIAGALGAPAPATPPIPPVAETAPTAASLPPQPPISGQPLPPVAQAPQAPPQRPAAPPPVAPAQNPQMQGVVLADPLSGAGRVSSRYGAARPNGRTHNGLDYAAPAGTPVGAAAGGTVIRAWNDTQNGGGNSVRIRHEDGSITGYAHMRDLNVQTGDTVRGGQPIGTVGSTGRSSGNHLHFTYRDPNGRRVDPSTIRFGEAATPTAPTPQVEEAPVQQAAAQPPVDPSYGVPVEAMPTAPQAVGPTRSRGLQAGYELAAGGNPYESDRAQRLIEAGLINQTELDELAANRTNDMNMVGYRAGLDRYAGDRTQIRSQNYGTSEREAGQRYGTSEREASQRYGTSEREASQRYGTSEREAGQNFTAGQAALDRSAQRSNLELQVGSREERDAAKAQEKRNSFFSTPTGSDLLEKAENAVQSNNSAINDLNEFLRLNAAENTGGWRERAPLGLDTFGSANLQAMDAISNRLGIELSSKLKGALSDKDMERVTNANVGITRRRAANTEIARLQIQALERANQYEEARIRSRADNDLGFIRDWTAYTNAVPIDNPQTFDEWRASVPTYDAQGNLVQ